MAGFKYDLHAHTSQTSNCSHVTGEELANLYKKLGYDGFCITDHFNGSTTIPDGVSWRERVNLFCKGYEAAFEEGKKLGIKVFFGWEHSIYDGTDFVVLGLDKEWLLQHEEIIDLEFKDYSKLIHESGGILFQAHPFREDYYIKYITLAPRDVDAVEVYNANRKPEHNERALWYAKSYQLPQVAGSDIHSVDQSNMAFVESTERVDTIFDLMEHIKSGSLTIGKISR